MKRTAIFAGIALLFAACGSKSDDYSAREYYSDEYAEEEVESVEETDEQQIDSMLKQLEEDLDWIEENMTKPYDVSAARVEKINELKPKLDWKYNGDFMTPEQAERYETLSLRLTEVADRFNTLHNVHDLAEYVND